MRGGQFNCARGDRARAQALIAALAEQRHDVRVVEDVARRGGRAPVAIYRRLVRPAAPKFLALMLRDAGRWRYAQGHGRYVAETAVEQRADVIIETQVNFAASGALAARLTGTPLVLDDCSPSAEERLLGAGLPGLAQRILRKQTRVAAIVIAVTRTSRERLISEGIPAEKIRLLPNGVNLAGYRRVDREAARARFGLGPEVAIGFVGSFQPWHAAELLVRALARLRAHRPVRLILIGDGPGRGAAVALARQLGVPFCDVGPASPDELPELVSTFDIGVVPGSNDYGQPMKLLDYAAASAAPVAPDLPPVREMLRHERTGLLFPAGDVDALARQIDRLIQNDPFRVAVGEEARRLLAEPASWQTRAATLSSWLAPLLNPSLEGRALPEPGRRECSVEQAPPPSWR